MSEKQIPCGTSRMFSPARAARSLLWTARQYVGRVVLLALALNPAPVSAQLPATQLDGIFPLGARPGTSVELTISGDDLDDVDRLQFSHPGITAAQKTTAPTKFDDGPQPVENTFDVSVAANVPPGRYQVRCQGKYGLSNPRSFMVSTLPDFTEAEPNNDVGTATDVSIPCIIDGRSSASADVDWYMVKGTPGQELFIDGRAQELDSLMNPVLTVCDAAGNIMNEARAAAGSDPTLGVSLPANGSLWLKVHDAQYRQGSGYSYRIRIQTRPQIDFVFPPAVIAGQSASFSVYGRNLPDGAATDLTVNGVALQKKDVTLAIPADAAGRLTYSGRIEPHMAGLDGLEYRLKDGERESNPFLLTLTRTRPVTEQADNDRPESAQQLTVPCEVAGQFYPQRDIDWYQFDAKKDEVYAIELYSHRLGLRTDAAMLLQQVTKKEDGTEQVRDIVFLDDVSVPNNRNEFGRYEFETSSADPSYLLTVPADGTYRVLLRDSAGSVQNDPRLVYRFTIRPPQHDFRLIAVPANSLSSLVLRREGRQMIRVFAERQDGFDGEIRVKVEGLPAGVTADEIVIGPSNRMGTLILTASDQAQPVSASVQVTGTATIGGKAVAQKARFGSTTLPFRVGQPNSRLPNVPARITDDIQLCVTDVEPAPALLTIGEGKDVETSRGMSVKIKYKAAKRDGIGGNLLAFPMDFPAQTSAQQVTIGNNKEGEFELRLNSASPPGRYSIFLAGYIQNMPYKRNPESVEAAKKRQERIAKIQADATKASQDTARAAQEKLNELNRANAAVNTATPAKQAAERNLVTAMSQMTAAQKSRDDLKAQSDAAPDDENLKKQLAEAETALTVAVTAFDKATAEAAKAAKALDEATATQKAAMEAKTAADKAAAEARTFVQEAQREKQKVDQLVRTREQNARQRNINVVTPSNALVVRLAEYPVELTDPGEHKAKQGEKLEVPLTFKRLFDYKGNLSVQVRPPSGVGGISVGTVNVSGDKTDGKLNLTLATTATPGRHSLSMRITFSGLNGTLVMERPLILTVEEKPKAE